MNISSDLSIKSQEKITPNTTIHNNYITTIHSFKKIKPSTYIYVFFLSFSFF